METRHLHKYVYVERTRHAKRIARVRICTPCLLFFFFLHSARIAFRWLCLPLIPALLFLPRMLTIPADRHKSGCKYVPSIDDRKESSANGHVPSDDGQHFIVFFSKISLYEHSVSLLCIPILSVERRNRWLTNKRFSTEATYHRLHRVISAIQGVMVIRWPRGKRLRSPYIMYVGA